MSTRFLHKFLLLKYYVFFLLCIVFFSCEQPQNNNDEIVRDSDSASETNTLTVIKNPNSVEDIKQLYANLNKKLQSGMLDSTSIKYDCNGERTGTVTYFAEDEKVKIIRHTYNEYSHFSATDQYFLSDDKLFFAHLTGVSWSFQSGKAATGATKDDITEKRLYIVREKPLLCLGKRYVKKSDSQDNLPPESAESKEVNCKA
jgi:hypothetical protein